jgi:hypothetical protein
MARGGWTAFGAVALAALGCNAIFDIDEGHLVPAGSGSTTSRVDARSDATAAAGGSYTGTSAAPGAGGAAGGAH